MLLGKPTELLWDFDLLYLRTARAKQLLRPVHSSDGIRAGLRPRGRPDEGDGRLLETKGAWRRQRWPNIVPDGKDIGEQPEVRHAAGEEPHRVEVDRGELLAMARDISRP